MQLTMTLNVIDHDFQVIQVCICVNFYPTYVQIYIIFVHDIHWPQFVFKYTFENCG
jgi:hypothetical protein